MIIWGSRMYFRKNAVEGWGVCEHCGKYGKNTSYNGRKFGHVYFIPLFPSGPRARVIKECKKCSTGMHIPEDAVPDILNSLRQSTHQALTALAAGQKTFDNNGQDTASTSYLAGSVEMLHCFQADDHLSMILATLQEKRLNQAYQLVTGETLEFQGKLDEAAEAYAQAAASEPNDVYALTALGSVQMKKKDYQGARINYERALATAEDKIPIYEVLITIYETLKDYIRLAETYEQCFQLIPELKSDKKFVKEYKKACKKAGRHSMLS